MTFTIKAAIAATALLVATPALANDQLARSLGQTPGVFTTQELVQLQQARQTGNVVAERQILRAGGERVTLSTQSRGGAAAIALRHFRAHSHSDADGFNPYNE